jgi:SAM-dependent methyltransferase
MGSGQPCPLCDAPSRRLWEGTRATFHCSGCGAGWVAPAPASGESRWSAGYYERNYLPRREALLSDFRGQLDRLTGNVSGSRWLDVGCGGGFFAAAALERGWKVTGIDPSPEAVHLARSVAPEARLVCGTSTDLPPGETYDVLSFWDSLAHIPAAAEELERYLERLSPGGFVVVKTPHRPPRFLYGAGLLAGWRPELRDDLTYARITSWHFSPASLGALLRREGLEVVSWQWDREVPDPQSKQCGSVRIVLRQSLVRLLRWIVGRHPSFVMVARKPLRAAAPRTAAAAPAAALR